MVAPFAPLTIVVLFSSLVVAALFASLVMVALVTSLAMVPVIASLAMVALVAPLAVVTVVAPFAMVAVFASLTMITIFASLASFAVVTTLTTLTMVAVPVSIAMVATLSMTGRRRHILIPSIERVGLPSVFALLSSFVVVTALAVMAIFIALAWLTRVVMITLSALAVVGTLVRGRANGTRSTVMERIAAEFVRFVSLHETEEVGLGLGGRSGSGAGPCVAVAALHMHRGVYRREFNVDGCKRQGDLRRRQQCLLHPQQ
jgi:hypothetical protein